MAGVLRDRTNMLGQAAEAQLQQQKGHTMGRSSDAARPSESHRVQWPRRVAAEPAAPMVPMSDFDLQHQDSVQHCSDLTRQIFFNMHRDQRKFKVDPHYMQRQSQVTEKMRTILIDWLVDCHLKYECRPETFFLTCNLVDRYCEKRSIMKSKFQLLGCAAMMAAAKYEEMFPPEVGDYVHISANTYKKEEMIAMERSVVDAVEFRLTCPTSYPFVMRYINLCQLDKDQTFKHCCLYLAEQSCVCYAMLQWQPSVQAAACVVFASEMTGRGAVLHPAIAQEAHLTPAEWEPALLALQDWMRKVVAMKYHALRKKYASSKRGAVASRFDKWAQDQAAAASAAGSQMR